MSCWTRQDNRSSGFYYFERLTDDYNFRMKTFYLIVWSSKSNHEPQLSLNLLVVTVCRNSVTNQWSKIYGGRSSDARTKQIPIMSWTNLITRLRFNVSNRCWSRSTPLTNCHYFFDFKQKGEKILQISIHVLSTLSWFD